MTWSQQHFWRRVGARSPDTNPAAMGVRHWALPARPSARSSWQKAALSFLLHNMLSTTWEDWGVITREHDPLDYSGTPSHFFEAVLRTSGGVGVRARLYNITTDTPVGGSVVSTDSATAVRKRSPAFTLPDGDNEYKAQIGRAV